MAEVKVLVKGYAREEGDVEFASSTVTLIKEGSLKIIVDPIIDMEFGIGALGVTPAHSIVDWQMAEANGLDIVKIINEDGIIRDKLAAMEQFSEQVIEDMLRSLAEERQVGLGKVAQPLRVALCGTTVSLPIFDSVQMLGKENTLKRVDITLKKFESEPRGEKG